MNIKCICCSKELLTIFDDVPNKASYSNGGADNINIGYGSIYDTENFYIGICDDCIKKKLEEGILVRV
jgi:hypothetical protein